MKIAKMAVAASLLLAACQPMKEEEDSAKIQYPVTRKDTTVKDNYFGTIVADPYRWLENDTAEEVKEWVKAQNKVTEEYLSRIPYRQAIKDRLAEIWNYPRYSAPFRKGDKYFYYKNDGLQNQSVLYVQDDLDGEGKLFFDPNKLSADGTVSLGVTSFSKDGKLMGYAINRSGSDWQEIYVMDVESGKRLKDSLRWVKFSDIAWQGDGFYYSRFPQPSAGSDLSSQNENQQIYFHKLGTSQEQDVKVFEDPAHPRHGFGAETTKDQRYLFVYGSEGAASGNSLYYKRTDVKDAAFKKLFDGFEYNYVVIDNIDDKFLILTDKGAPHFRLVLVDPAKPDTASWQIVIPEKKDVLQSATLAGGKIFAKYMQDASNHVYQFDMKGNQEKEIKLPALGSVSGFDGEKEDSVIFYTFTSFTYPPTIFKYTIATGRSELFRKSEVKFNPDDYVTEQVFYKSYDGTKIPMFIVHKKGLEMDGTNPAYLYGYGGFNISLNPYFSVSRLILLENGGVFAMPNLRGGGEYGEEWHKAGMLFNKKKVFEDFMAAAEYLSDNGYTNADKLAIAGGSNGGLLVGACLTFKSDHFKVAFPAVGVMDMLRYHKFTIGHAWVSEYGSSDSAKQFKYLYSYSPLHNITPGKVYPATLVTTADHDDRVVPAHSFKFIATLQEKHAGLNPALIRIETKAGHGAGKPTQKQIEEWADIWSFFFYNIGVTPSYGTDKK